jgi:LysM repeat protein
MTTMQEEKRRSDIASDEMRIEIADLKHALSSMQLEVSIVEEKLKRLETIHKESQLGQQIISLEKKLQQFQRIQEQSAGELEQLRKHANETSQALHSFAQEIHSQNQRFEEISKLKATLSLLSKAISEPAHASTAAIHRVKSGETLEKIARQHNTTVAELKQLNKLDHDRIMIGQDLKLPQR